MMKLPSSWPMIAFCFGGISDMFVSQSFLWGPKFAKRVCFPARFPVSTVFFMPRCMVYLREGTSKKSGRPGHHQPGG
jgi:hypothetical protein